MNVKLIAVTQAQAGISPEELMVYCARVSSPQNQDNHDSGAKLLGYCMRNGHWSVFETVSMTVEITTSVAIATQILRHRSFTFQQFSQRYADASQLGFEQVQVRRQDTKNRQNSIDDLPEETRDWFRFELGILEARIKWLYGEALRRHIAKECARFVLPQNTTTRLYMTGSCRSFIHYLQTRCDPATQLEHREVALLIRDVFAEQFPTVASLLRL